MELPIRLQTLCDEAGSIIVNDSLHDLPAGYRQLVYRAFGEKTPQAHTKLAQGHHCRATLAILSARAVLPLWEHTHPRDERPHRILQAAEQVVQGKSIDMHTIHPLCFSTFDASTRADDVGLAATWALSAATHDSDLMPELAHQNINDSQLDVNQRDTAFFAAIAFADGPPWFSTSDAQRRRTFWEWWLLEAVPMAWGSVLEA